jgi:hypothetical protein
VSGDIWASAWKEGQGEENVGASKLGPAGQEALEALYNDPQFQPSVGLTQLAKILTGTAAPNSGSVATRSGPQSRGKGGTHPKRPKKK